MQSLSSFPVNLFRQVCRPSTLQFVPPAIQYAAMSTRRAVVIKGPGLVEVSDNVPLPKLRDEYIIVKTKAVALNPTDWKGLGSGSVGSISGCDYSGIVEEVGNAVTNGLKKGDRVAGFIRGGE
jgi:NADPH:quinone reductase-like Zn-dependent oxidoreductase